MTKKERDLGYTAEELIFVDNITPKFACPKCQKIEWHPLTRFHSGPTRIWLAQSHCASCNLLTKWLIDPDRPLHLQPKRMHRPIG